MTLVLSLSIRGGSGLRLLDACACGESATGTEHCASSKGTSTGGWVKRWTPKTAGINSIKIIKELAINSDILDMLDIQQSLV